MNCITVKKVYHKLLEDCKRDQCDDRIWASENKIKFLWNICWEITGKTINQDADKFLSFSFW